MTGILCSLDCWPCPYLSWPEKKITWQKFLQTYDGSWFINTGQTFRATESIQLFCSLQLICLPESVCTSLSSLKWPIIFYFLFISLTYDVWFILFHLFVVFNAMLWVRHHSAPFIHYLVPYSPDSFLSVTVSSLFFSFTCYIPLSSPVKRGLMGR